MYDVVEKVIYIVVSMVSPFHKFNPVFDVCLKLNSKPRRPLTMGFQKSEYKDEYEPTANELAYEFDRPIRPKLYLYDDEVNTKLTEVCSCGCFY